MEGAWLLGPDFGGKAMSEVKYTEEEIEKIKNDYEMYHPRSKEE